MKLTLIGFVQALILNMQVIAGMNDPQLKISPVGFLKCLMENNAAAEVVNLPALQAGNERDIKVRYMQRGIESEVTDVDNCDTNIVPEWKQTSIGIPMYSKIGIFISDDNMRKYQEEASQTLAAGSTPAVPLMRALYETILVHANALVQKIDSNLLAAQASKFGVNAAYGNSNAQQITLGKTAELNNGVVKLISDAEANEVEGELLVVGSGLIRQYDIYNRFKNGSDAAGIGSMGLNTYVDPKTATKWGANHFGVFAKGNIGFIPFCKNVGNFAGERGGSVFFTLPMPVTLANGELSTLKFDCQLKYVDCPQVNAEGETIAERGWKLIVGLHYGLFNMPNDSYRSGDPLYGVNGSFHYVAVPEGATPSSSSAASSSSSAASSSAASSSAAEA